MHKLGISVYPEHSTPEKDQAYMESAAGYGFTRIFTCLLSVQKAKEEIITEFTDFMNRAHALGYEVAVDTNPDVFKHLGATPLDLKVFHDMHVDIIRLDGHFDDFLDRAITHNEYGIKIEFNGSADSSIDYLLKHGADPHNVTICHNFYPERYSGIGWKLFMNLNEKWKGLGLHTAAFVTSREPDTFGPWPVSAGLPTVELHRTKPIDVQLRHMLACELIDDILIGNAYASEAELKAMAAVDLSKTTIRMELEKDICAAEKKALFDYPHTGRQDASDYYIRSSLPRFFFKEEAIPQRMSEQRMFHRGEIEILLTDMENDGERNLVGHIANDDMMILDEMEKHPEHLFGFIE